METSRAIVVEFMTMKKMVDKFGEKDAVALARACHEEGRVKRDCQSGLLLMGVIVEEKLSAMALESAVVAELQN